jgi:hypothetical protein
MRVGDKGSASAIHITIGVTIVHNNPATLEMDIKALANSFTNIKEKKKTNWTLVVKSKRSTKIDVGGFTVKSFLETQLRQSILI